MPLEVSKRGKVHTLDWIAPLTPPNLELEKKSRISHNTWSVLTGLDIRCIFLCTYIERGLQIGRLTACNTAFDFRSGSDLGDHGG